MEQFKRIFIITSFDIDIEIEYPFKSKYIMYTEDDIKNYIKNKLVEIYNKYNIDDNISYDDFYNKSNLIIEVSAISLNYKNILNKNDYDKYLSEVKNISKEELKDYLMDKIDCCSFVYDQNLNLKYTSTSVIDNPNFNYCYNQYAFSYKALFPEKYHVDKYKGDKVLYEDEIYTVIDIVKPSESIFKFDDPLNYRYGYILYDGYNITPDDKFGYYPVDEDLKLIKD